MLHIHLFGHLRLLADGHLYRFQGLPKTTGLLAYLLLHRHTPVARDHLAFLLWDDVPESEARANLRRHLHDLHRALPPDVEWLLRDTKSVQWNPGAPAWLDVAEFEHLCHEHDRLTEAIALYTGDLLQASYEDWIVPERERLQALYLSSLARLMAREWERGDLIQAMVYARQLLSHDPLREDVMRDYMLLRQASGDRAGAMQLYQQFQARLLEELGVAPMPETTAVYEQLSHSQPAGADSRPARHSTAPMPPAPAAAPPQNLPARLTSFVGRQEELAQVCRLIGSADSPVRLLTITGSGGTGKTRLAVEAASWLWQQWPQQFPDGVYLVGLSAVSNPEHVAIAVAESLELRGRPELSPLESLRVALRDKRSLLLLDNFEHLLDAAPLLAELLTSLPHLRLLVTSQTALHLYGEQEFPLQPLALPEAGHLPDAADLLNYAAVRLFVDRTQAVQPQFQLNAGNMEAVAEICRCLDGIPLALELAAGRGKLFTPAAMLAQLSHRLRFLTSQARDLPARHQTLRATVEWSYNQLTPAEQTLFAGVALFAGPFTLSAAEAIFGNHAPANSADDAPPASFQPDLTEMSDLLFSLVDKNMLRALPAEGTEELRFRMLQTLREHGLEKLTQVETAKFIYHRYADYYATLAEQCKEGMRSADQSAWVQRLRQEENNLIAALEWLASDRDNDQSGVLMARTVTAVSRFWLLQGRVHDLRHWLQQALAYLSHLPPAQQVALLSELGNVAQIQGDYTIAEKYHRQALSLARQVGESLLIANSLHFLAYAAGRQGQYAGAKALFQESLALYRQLPEINPLYFTALLNNLAIVHKRLGEFDAAIALLQEVLTVKRAVKDHLGLPASLANLGNLLILQGKPLAARVYMREALELRQQNQDRQGMLNSINQMASLAAVQGQHGHAATLYAAADALHQAMGISRTADGREDQEREMETIRRRLDADELAERQTAGSCFTLEEAVHFALTEVTPPDSPSQR